jgi:hypothetical protein
VSRMRAEPMTPSPYFDLRRSITGSDKAAGESKSKASCRRRSPERRTN